LHRGQRLLVVGGTVEVELDKPSRKDSRGIQKPEMAAVEQQAPRRATASGLDDGRTPPRIEPFSPLVTISATTTLSERSVAAAAFSKNSTSATPRNPTRGRWVRPQTRGASGQLTPGRAALAFAALAKSSVEATQSSLWWNASDLLLEKLFGDQMAAEARNH